jgi:hypothetical protein
LTTSSSARTSGTRNPELDGTELNRTSPNFEPDARRSPRSNEGPANSALVVAHDTALRSRQRFVSLHRFEAQAGTATRAPAALTHDTRRARENGAHGNATN